MVSGSLALLYFLLGFHGGRQGSGPDRGRSPVEWGDFPSVRPFVRPFVHPSVHSPLLAIQPGLRPSQPDLRPSQPSLKPETWLAGWLGLRPGWLGLRPGWLGLRPGWMAQRGGRTDERMYERTDGRKISPFYRTSSPIGAAAQKKVYSKLTVIIISFPRSKFGTNLPKED